MALLFPSSPSVNDEYTDPNGQIWICTAVSPAIWDIKNDPILSAPVLVTSKETISTTAVSPDLDSYSTHIFNFTGALTVNAPTMVATALDEKVRSGYMVINSNVTGVTWNAVYKFNGGTAPTGAGEFIVFYTVRDEENIICDVWSAS